MFILNIALSESYPTYLQAASPLHAGLCTVFELLLRPDGPAQAAAAQRLYSSLVEPIAVPSAQPPLAGHPTAGGASLAANKSLLDRGLQPAEHGDATDLAAHSKLPGRPDQAGPDSMQYYFARPTPRPRLSASRDRPPVGSRERNQQRSQGQLRWEPDQEDQRWRQQDAVGGPRWQGSRRPGGAPPRPPQRPWQRPPLGEDRSFGSRQAQGDRLGQRQQPGHADNAGLGGEHRNSISSRDQQSELPVGAGWRQGGNAGGRFKSDRADRPLQQSGVHSPALLCLLLTSPAVDSEAMGRRHNVL